MQQFRRSKEQLCLALMIGLCLEAHTLRAAEPVQGAVFKVRIANEATAVAVERSLAGASRRLGDPRCQSVLTEFKDASGRTLVERLEATGQTHQEYLRSVLFYDGSNERRCGVRGTLAITAAPGSRVVLICGAAFMRTTFLDQQLAEVTIIHEALHTLGLGENLPTSREITSRVMSRCHRNGGAQRSEAPRSEQDEGSIDLRGLPDVSDRYSLMQDEWEAPGQAAPERSR